MNIVELTIANIKAPIPIIQGGMAVRISTAQLAAAVANEGGIGIIAGTGMTVKELVEEIRKARSMTNGIIGVNVLFAVKNFADLVIAAIEEGIDLIISGAGFSRDMFSWGKKSNTPIVPIVSSAKLAVLAQKLGAAAVVVEGKEAGGHLGTDRPTKDILIEVIKSIKIPAIAAGGIINGQDISEMIRLGASGVQLGTIFAVSEESNASTEMKELYLKSKKEDIVIVKSPVGLPGRVLRNNFYNLLQKNDALSIDSCVSCLKRCSQNFCIMKALLNACKTGNPEEALIFAGEKAYKVNEILPVKTIFRNLLSQITRV